MDTTTTAWAAGLFEGEGCISRCGRHGEGLAIEVSMTDRDVIERFAAAVGAGRVAPRVLGGRDRDGRLAQWRWYCGRREEVMRIMTELMPYLGTRRQTRYAELVEATWAKRRDSRPAPLGRHR